LFGWLGWVFVWVACLGCLFGLLVWVAWLGVFVWIACLGLLAGFVWLGCWFGFETTPSVFTKVFTDPQKSTNTTIVATEPQVQRYAVVSQFHVIMMLTCLGIS
jgi:hypothetical protein